mmetsp:Transcript_7810/g.22183  ORF Transcript_7810/g.22183 Transcript_7810/m.22183 type:complete len:238 (+) Transcript_7810:180-893(+)
MPIRGADALAKVKSLFKRNAQLDRVLFVSKFGKVLGGEFTVDLGEVIFNALSSHMRAVYSKGGSKGGRSTKESKFRMGIKHGLTRKTFHYQPIGLRSTTPPKQFCQEVVEDHILRSVDVGRVLDMNLLVVRRIPRTGDSLLQFPGDFDDDFIVSRTDHTMGGWTIRFEEWKGVTHQRHLSILMDKNLAQEASEYEKGRLHQAASDTLDNLFNFCNVAQDGALASLKATFMKDVTWNP